MVAQFLVASVWAQTTRLVTTTADSGPGSLRGAIDLANAYDRIVFAPVVRGKIRLISSEILIDKPLTILGPGASELAISGNNHRRIFNIGSQGNVEIHGLTITEGVDLGANGVGPGDEGIAALGGGILNFGRLALLDCMITTNRAQGGRGGDGRVGQIEQSSVIAGNGGYARAGAIFSGGTLTATRCTFLGNTAQGGTGGDGGRDQSFTSFGSGGHGGSVDGGAIVNYSASTEVRLENCTFSDNHAAGGAGGLPWPLVERQPGRGGHALGGALSGPVFLTGCTVVRNSADGGRSLSISFWGSGTAGGALGSGAPTAVNSIIALNTVSGIGNQAPDVAHAGPSSWTSLGGNLIGVTDGSSGWTGNDLLGNGSFPINPLLGPCQDNGGPVWTMSLLAGSPARDKGRSDLVTDARGGPRIVDFPNIPNAPGGNGSDIGALELDSLLRIVSIAKSSAVAWVRFKTDPGNNYTLQQTSVLTNRTWTNIVSRSGNGQIAEDVDTAATAWQRFYRVRSDASAFAQCAPPPSGLVSWWRAEGNALDEAGSNPGTMGGGLGFAPGHVGQAFNFTSSGQLLTMPASASLNVGAGPGFTVEGWIKPADAVTQMPIAEWNNAGSPAAHLWISVDYAGFGGLGSIYFSLHGGVDGIFSTGPGVIQAGAWQHVAVTFDRTSGDVRLYRNGIQVGASNLAGQVAATTPNLYLGARPGGPSFRGGLDELSLYGRALSPVEILALYNTNDAGKCR